MGRISQAAKEAAKAKLKKKFGHDYCENSPTNKHQWTKWRNEEHPNHGLMMGPGSHLVFHCRHCGKVKK